MYFKGVAAVLLKAGTVDAGVRGGAKVGGGRGEGVGGRERRGGKVV